MERAVPARWENMATLHASNHEERVYHADEENKGVPTKCPPVVGLLCGLSFLSLPFHAIALAGLSKDRIAASNPPWPFAGRLDLVILLVASQGTLLAFAAVGMWRGKKWGWRLALVLYSYLTLWQVSELALGPLFPPAPTGAPAAATRSAHTFQGARAVGRIAFDVLALAYLILARAAARFFNVPLQPRRSRVRAVIVPIAIGAAILVLLRVCGYLI